MRLALSYQRVDPSKGGAETYVADLCRRLVMLGHEVDLVTESGTEGALPESVGRIQVAAGGRGRGGRIWHFAAEAERVLRRREGVYDCTVGFINTWHQDVLIPQGGVHAASLEANARRHPPGLRRSLYLLGKRANPKWWGLYHAIERRQYDPSRPTRYVAVSEMVRGHLKRFQGVADDRIRVIPNAIDAGRLAVPDPSATRQRFREAQGLGNSEVVGLFAGHNYRLKGLPPMLQALKRRREESTGARPIRLVVCGGGEIASIGRLVNSLGLGDAVRLAGFVPDVRDAYHAADFFVLPTFYDPCSLVVFEALACGLPVVTTRCNGASELLTEGREGYVIDRPDDQSGLIRALDRLADDEVRCRMSEAARRLGREQSMDRHVARLVELFAEVAAASPLDRAAPPDRHVPRKEAVP